jgi:hypothetical protein
MHKQGKSRLVGAKVAGGLSFASFSLAGKENEDKTLNDSSFFTESTTSANLLSSKTGFQKI